MKKYSLLLLILIVGYSCSVQKRHYRSGYEIDFGSKKKEGSALKQNVAVYPIEKKRDSVIINPIKEYNEVASTLPDLQINKPITEKEENCDVINFRNGETLKAKIVEINQTEISYKNCANLDGPLIIIDKNTVKSIKYKNGFVEEFAFIPKQTIKQKNTNTTNNSETGKIESFAIASFVCGLLFFLYITPILAVIFGLISLKRIKENPTLRGKGLAIGGLVLGLLFLFIVALIVLIVIGSI